MLCARVYGCMLLCFFQAEDGIRDLVRSRGLGDVYKRQPLIWGACEALLRVKYPGNNEDIWIIQDLSLIHI